MAIKREQKALREFKEILRDVVRLLCKATGAKMVHLHWVNRSRAQFVLETHSTSLSNVMFRDRVPVEEHFLNQWVDIDQIRQIEVGKDLAEEELSHYHDQLPVRHLMLVPFVNQGETVAITVLESEEPLPAAEMEIELSAYRNALLNILNTYLELTDLLENQIEWEEYEEGLDSLSDRLHKVEILSRAIGEMQKLLTAGGVVVLARGMETWSTVLATKEALDAPLVGLMLDEKSVAREALQNGKPEFAIHFNRSPKRISTDEGSTEGATLAIPLLIGDRRQAVAVVYDRNPLIFKESVKHRLVNLLRVAGQAIRIHTGESRVDQDFLASEYGSFIPELWEKTLELERDSGRISERHTWFGFITVDNVRELRAAHRLETLQRLQKKLVTSMNPARFGYAGFIGFHTDYIYTFILQSERPDSVESWLDRLSDMVIRPVALSGGEQVQVRLKSGFTRVTEDDNDLHRMTGRAKTALSEAVRSDQVERVEG
ncbi:MAG: GAF domain-containing protein [Balneolaceae bacterium]